MHALSLFSLSFFLSHDFTWRCNQRKKYKIKQAQLSEVSSWNYVRVEKVVSDIKYNITLLIRMLGLFVSYKSHEWRMYFSILLKITPKWLPGIMLRLIAINQQLRKLKNMTVAIASIAGKSWKKMVSKLMFGSDSALVVMKIYQIDQKSTKISQMVKAYHLAIRKMESMSTTGKLVGIGL